MIDGHDVYILEALRKCVLDLQSPEYQKKLEIVAFLEGKGLNYYKESIPDYIINMCIRTTARRDKFPQ